MVYDLDSIKQRNPIKDIVAAHGVALRESGAHLVGYCPFHQDEHPSFAVYPETRSFYCFGCNAGGDIIDFVRRATHVPDLRLGAGWKPPADTAPFSIARTPVESPAPFSVIHHFRSRWRDAILEPWPPTP